MVSPEDGTIIQCKSPFVNSEEWGISLGNNLEIKGRILPQPKLLYGREKICLLWKITC